MKFLIRTFSPVFAVVALWGTNSARADFLAVTPTVIEVSARAGKTVRGKFTVVNNESKPVSLLLDIRNADLPRAGEPPPPRTVDWLKVKASPRMVIQPNKSRSVSYRIKVPDDLSGERIARVYFTPEASDFTESVGIQMRVGVPIYLTASGTEKAALSLGSSSVTRREDRGLQFSIVLQLEGNAHIRPRGEFQIRDTLGFEIERVTLDYGTPIFPGESKTYSAKSDRSWLPGTYAVELKVDYGANWGEIPAMTKDFRMTISDDAALLEETQGVP